jgi:hypothetical protein
VRSRPRSTQSASSNAKQPSYGRILHRIDEHAPDLSQPALKALARRSAVPVKLDLRARRWLPEHVAVTAYYAMSEVLTNAAEHAHAVGAE